MCFTRDNLFVSIFLILELIIFYPVMHEKLHLPVAVSASFRTGRKTG